MLAKIKKPHHLVPRIAGSQETSEGVEQGISGVGVEPVFKYFATGIFLAYSYSEANFVPKLTTLQFEGTLLLLTAYRLVIVSARHFPVVQVRTQFNQKTSSDAQPISFTTAQNGHGSVG